jgi:predicted DNA-binding transcriptional regulator YafY
VATALHRGDPSALFPILEDLRQAAREQRQVTAVYQSASGSASTRRTIDPYALVFRAGLWYLVGHCHLRRAPRTFRVDRILELDVLDEGFEISEAFDIHTYLDREFKDQPTVRARLRFKPEAAHIVRGNRLFWEIAGESHDGSLEVVLSGPDLPFLASMVLSFSAWTEVLDPPELRDLVRDWAQATAQLYA